MNTLTVGLIIAVGMLGGFYAGARYGQGHPLPSSPTAATSQGTALGAGGAGGGGRGAGQGGGAGFVPAATGQIVAVNGDIITVHDRTSNKDVKVNVGSARITKNTEGTPADLTQNTAVTVIGQTGGDGVVTAQTIAIGGGGGARFGGGGQPSPGSSGG